jgi:hypothetical protein
MTIDGDSPKREYLAPTDIICIVAMILLAGLYALTREPEIKQGFLGLVLFLAGRQSTKKQS